VYQEKIKDLYPGEGRNRVMFSIDFPNATINETAYENNVESTLSLIGVPYFVKAPFNKHMMYSFNCFDADEQLEAMEEYLKKEIDFEYLLGAGIIESNYPLHNGDVISNINESYNKYKYKLMFSMLTGNYNKYFEPINMIKNYYGEKYAY
jgi:hypothetical protein